MRRAYLDVADMEEADAMHYLEQEMRSHLDDISGEALRRDYLLSLRERFPLLLSQKSELDSSHLASLTEVTDISPEHALGLVQKAWSGYAVEQRDDFLEAIGLGKSSSDNAATHTSHLASTDSSLSASAEMSRFLKLPEEANISEMRLHEMFLNMLKTLSQIDALGTQVYRQLGLARDLNQEDLRKQLGCYLSEEGTSADAINKILNETRLKIGLVISSIAGLPATLSQSHLARFQPEVIEQVIGKGGILGGKEAKCWKQYVTMASELQPGAIEKSIHDIIAKQLRKLKHP